MNKVNEINAITIFPREVWVGWFSSLVEAYIMAIYSFTAPFLASFLFEKSGTNSIFFSYFFVFIGSCFFYPLGAIYYGFLGDTKGRQKIGIHSSLGLSYATGLMGLIPIGLLSSHTWIYFLVLICAQHFFSGGEYHGSIIFSLEHGKNKNPNLMSSLSCLFAVFGLLLANGLATISFLTRNEQWIKICFFLGAFGGWINYLLKKYSQETPAFLSIPKGSLQDVNWIDFIKSEWKAVGNVISVLAFFIVSYSFIFIFLPLTYADHTFDTFKSLIAYGFFLLVAGLMADRMGVKMIMLLGVSLFSILIVPSCYWCQSLFTLQIILTSCACLAIGPIHNWLLNQFQAQNRCRGIFISSAIATSFFGGSTVPICLLIFEKTHSLSLCSLYPLLIALISFRCLTSNLKD